MRIATSLLQLACAILPLLVCAPGAQGQTSEERRAPTQIKSNRQGRSRHITLADIVSTREVTEQQISPDGGTVAFIVKQAFLEGNEDRSALFIVKTDGVNRDSDEPVKLLEEKSIVGIRWSPDGNYITYLSGNSGSTQIWRISSQGGESEKLFHHDPGVLQYALSPDGRQVAIISSNKLSAGERNNLEQRGIVYKDQYTFLDLLNGSWVKESAQLWLYDLVGRKGEKIWEHPAPINRMSWSPDGQKIAVEYIAHQKYQDRNDYGDIGVVYLNDRKFVPLITWKGRDVKPSWSPDGRSIAFVSEDGTEAQYSMSKYSIFLFLLGGLISRNLTPSLDVTLGSNIWWRRDGAGILFEVDDRSGSALYELSIEGGVAQKLTRGDYHLSNFSFSSDQSRISCIQQSPLTPPEVAIVDASNGVSTALTRLNPDYLNIRLGGVTELRWKNKYDYETNGFLLKPVDYEKGKRYPTLLILYGFSGKFISQAQWIPNYPAQVFARDGYAVLMMNYPIHYLKSYDDPKEKRFGIMYNPLASVEKAVEMLIDMGIADPKKMGIMGLSYGSFLTDFTITRSNLFQAASSADSGLFNPGLDWLGSVYTRQAYRSMMGGQPYGTSYKNWSEISPALNAHRASAPVLMEYRGQYCIAALEFYTALKGQKVPAELVVYPNDGHILFQPKHRFYSMQRNLEWFNFWLQGKEDHDPEKREQYSRWKAMKGIEKRNHSAITH
jgi:dipeptidyl aminopeptidase/acylaminoacyl peptidase